MLWSDCSYERICSDVSQVNSWWRSHGSVYCYCCSTYQSCNAIKACKPVKNSLDTVPTFIILHVMKVYFFRNWRKTMTSLLQGVYSYLTPGVKANQVDSMCNALESVMEVLLNTWDEALGIVSDTVSQVMKLYSVS